LLGKESGLASRRAVWQANHEVAELTGKVGKPAVIQRTFGRVALARDGFDRAIAIREDLVQANPKITQCRADLASSVRERGLARLISGYAAGAVADARRSAAIFEGLPPSSHNDR
jgi:hypothetical protein